MKKLHNLIGGLAGAVALNILHESLKRIDHTPRIDQLGKEALQKTLSHIASPIANKQQLYQATLAADIVSNTLYYSLIGAGKKSFLWPRAIFYGLSAGIGATKLPKPLGLNDRPVNKDTLTTTLTVVYYLFGALVTGLVIKKLDK